MIVVNDKCLKCGGCVAVCPHNALALKDKIECNEKCVSCGICVKFCPVGAISLKKEGE